MVDRYNMRGFKRCTAANAAQPQGGLEKCKALEEQLKKIDFSIVDTVLYLDAYPNSRKALEYYHKLIKERQETVNMLVNACDKPITAFDIANQDKWSWGEGPWPWENAAN